jgi:hypothetical protein
MVGRGSCRVLINLVIQETKNGCSGNAGVLADMHVPRFSSRDSVRAQQELRPTARKNSSRTATMLNDRCQIFAPPSAVRSPTLVSRACELDSTDSRPRFPSHELRDGMESDRPADSSPRLTRQRGRPWADQLPRPDVHTSPASRAPLEAMLARCGLEMRCLAQTRARGHAAWTSRNSQRCLPQYAKRRNRRGVIVPPARLPGGQPKPVHYSRVQQTRDDKSHADLLQPAFFQTASRQIRPRLPSPRRRISIPRATPLPGLRRDRADGPGRIDLRRARCPKHFHLFGADLSHAQG